MSEGRAATDRLPVDEDVVAGIVATIKAGNVNALPPLHVWRKQTGNVILVAGRNRLEAHKRAGCEEFNISAMTLWRWDRDPELAALGFPPPVTIRKRKFRVRKQLKAFKRTLLRRAIARRAESPAASSKMRGES